VGAAVTGGKGESSVGSAVFRHAADWRQLTTVVIYYALIGSMYFVPACRNVFFLVAACAYSFLTAVVNHNNLHQGMWKSRRANELFRLVLSFASLYPVSANVPSHNLVHHHFDDDGQPDWASPTLVRFKVNLFNLVHFPNVAGPVTFAGVSRYNALLGKRELRRQNTRESIFAFGLTALLLVHDFWTGLFFVVVPQLWGARSFLRINIIQHDGCDTASEHDHSRNFVGRVFNWFMMNNGFHTIHHDRAGLHWTALRDAHAREVAPHIDPRLDEPSMIGYLLRTYVFGIRRPTVPRRAAPAAVPERQERRQQAERDALSEVGE
jgi:beta-carotene hydroxylase